MSCSSSSAWENLRGFINSKAATYPLIHKHRHPPVDISTNGSWEKTIMPLYWCIETIKDNICISSHPNRIQGHPHMAMAQMSSKEVMMVCRSSWGNLTTYTRYTIIKPYVTYKKRDLAGKAVTQCPLVQRDKFKEINLSRTLHFYSVNIPLRHTQGSIIKIDTPSHSLPTNTDWRYEQPSIKQFW